MAEFCSFGQPDFVRWLISDGFVRQSKRALAKPCDISHLTKSGRPKLQNTGIFVKYTVMFRVLIKKPF